MTHKEYQNMNVSEQENFLSHSLADLVQKMYYEHNKSGLELLIKNLRTIAERARDCVDCLEMLHKEGDVYAKLWLMLEYMGHGGISEEFVCGLEQLTERAQECLARSEGAVLSSKEEQEVLERINAVIDAHEQEEINTGTDDD